MAARPPRARWRVVSHVVLCAFAVWTLASAAFADEGPAGILRPAPGQPIVQAFVVLQPQIAATVIGLTLAQMVAVPATIAAAATRAPAVQASQPSARPAARPRGLLPLYASYGVLQALDFHSTLVAVKAGAVEQNSILAPIVNRPAAFAAFKAATTIAVILASERVAKHNRVAAYVAMFALDSAYVYVVAHNYGLRAQLQR